jgi:hypothetical protein
MRETDRSGDSVSYRCSDPSCTREVVVNQRVHSQMVVDEGESFALHDAVLMLD